MLRSLRLSVLAVASLAACKSDPMQTPDTGVNPPIDTGVPDTGAPPDTGVPPDTGAPDTGDVPDAGDPDTGAPDVGPPPVVEVDVSGRVRQLGAYLAGNNSYVGSAAVLAYGVP